MKNRSRLLRTAFTALLAVGVHGCSHAIAPVSGSDPSGGAPAGSANTAVAVAAAPLPAAKETYRVPIDGLPSMGSAQALITLVAFTDYQCPYCQRAEETLSKLRAAYGSDLRVVVAERPLPTHDRARPAALAALAAGAQGKFEEMHTLLFEQAGQLDDASILGAARSAGLDLPRFEADRNAATLDPSERLADRFGVKGTPTFFVAGRRLVGAQPYEVFRDVIDERLAAAHSLVTSGVRPADVYAELVASGADHAVDDAKGDGPGCGESEADCKVGSDDGKQVGEAVEQVPTSGAPSRGPSRASVTIVAFGDFQCPFSSRAEATLRAVEAARPGDVRVVFKNLPLPMHPSARLAAKAALAADAQGHFWDFHDRLYARVGTSLDRAALDQIAADVGLDASRFGRDIDDPAIEARIVQDQADADALKVEGTPTFFVNGRRVIGAQPLPVFERVIAKSAGK